MAVTAKWRVIVLAAALAGCGRSDLPEEEPARTPRPLPDVLAQADSIVADLQRREAVQRAAEAQMPKPEGGIPVVNEFTPAQRYYRQPSYPAYTIPSGMQARSDERQWKSEAQLLDIRLQTALKYADASVARMESARLEMERRNTATYAQAQREYEAAATDYQFFMTEVETSRHNIERLRDAARQANVPPGWARWP